MLNSAPLYRAPLDVVKRYNLQMCMNVDVEMGQQVPTDLYYVARVELHSVRIYHIYLHNAAPTISKVGIDSVVHELVVTETLEVFYRDSVTKPYDLVGPLAAMHIPLIFSFFGEAADGLRELRRLLMEGRLFRQA